MTHATRGQNLGVGCLCISSMGRYCAKKRPFSEAERFGRGPDSDTADLVFIACVSRGGVSGVHNDSHALTGWGKHRRLLLRCLRCDRPDG